MTLSLETIAQVRQDYLDRKPLLHIAADHGISKHQVYRCINGVAFGLPPLPRQRVTEERRPRRLTGNRDVVVRRLWFAAERQVRDIENRLVLAEQVPAERERDARMMAVLVKTLCDLSALDGAKVTKPATRGAAKSTPAGPEHHDDATTDDGDDGPRDIEEFRRELARRIAGLAGDEASGTDGGPQSPRTEFPQR